MTRGRVSRFFWRFDSHAVGSHRLLKFRRLVPSFRLVGFSQRQTDSRANHV